MKRQVIGNLSLESPVSRATVSTVRAEAKAKGSEGKVSLRSRVELWSSRDHGKPGGGVKGPGQSTWLRQS